ncbi:MAG: hypothetical protein IKO55_14550 [Kiritimatiellae bacterium]|nr:hypothetical protein [Kiritimatiellia bacterium]
MKVNDNAAHNSIELDFEGVKPSEEVRTLLKAYGFWWFAKGKVWCHTLDIDAEFFKDFVETRVKPLVAKAAVPATSDGVAAAFKSLTDADQQALLAQLLAAQGAQK